MADNSREVEPGGCLLVLLAFLTLGTCSLADNTERIADALERMAPEEKD